MVCIPSNSILVPITLSFLLAGLAREINSIFFDWLFGTKNSSTEVENVTILSYILLKRHDCIQEDRKS